MKVKEWFKKHKKELIVGALAAGGTALYFMLKEKKVGIKAGIKLNLQLLDGVADENGYYGGHHKSDIYTNIIMHKPDLNLSDLGKLGDLLREKVPIITEDTKIDHLSVNYDLVKD